MLVEFAVLGPCAVTVGGVPTRLGGPRPRAVLARLLIGGGAVVGEDRIIEDVWHGAPPRRPRPALHTCVADLRRALEPGRSPRRPPRVLVRRGTGYALLAGGGTVDAVRFVEAARSGMAALAGGRPDLALELLDAALRLWRGAAYADLADLPFVRAEAEGLDEWRSLVREERVAALLALGQHRAALVEARSLTVDHPFRERGWALWAVALYRCDRQAEALSVLRGAACRLREDLGVEPGPALAAVTRRILAHDPDLRWVGPVDCQPNCSASPTMMPLGPRR
ncbi:AfsR/SARP family transcriptional regulator [Longispora sp. K20-0274]|uniref:AfsR/SARP family transcriptional regulator n=1 Tax=Longispora sp. K20-0274 TaxID=3088255 RepID=UPI003999D8E7